MRLIAADNGRTAKVMIGFGIRATPRRCEIGANVAVYGKFDTSLECIVEAIELEMLKCVLMFNDSSDRCYWTNWMRFWGNDTP